MANVKFCYPNWTLPSTVYTPTASGTGWIDLPNLTGEVLSEMARYPGVTPADTKLVIDLKTPRNIRVLAIPLHNAWVGDTARIRVCTDAGLTDCVLDTGWQEFFGEIYPYGSLEYGRVEWLDGRATPEQAAGQMPPWLHIAPGDVLGLYLDVQFDFTNNPNGCVDVGQIVAAPAVSPVYNISYGVKPPYYRDPSTKKRSKGGVQFADRQKSFRVTQMQLDWLGQQEAYGAFYEMVREYGITKPFFFIYDADAPAAILPKQCMMASAEKIGEPSHPHFGSYSMTIELSEAF